MRIKTIKSAFAGCLLAAMMSVSAHGASFTVDRTGGASGTLGVHLGSLAYDGNYDGNLTALIEGVEGHADRDNQQWREIPAFMSGADLLETLNNDKNGGVDGENYALTFSENSVLYVMTDDRPGNTHPFLLGESSGTTFTNTGLNMTLDENGIVRKMSIWSAPALAGQTINVGDQSGGTYFGIAANQELSPWTPYLKVDIGPDGQRVEAGATGLTGPAANTNVPSPNTVSTNATSIDGSVVGVDISSSVQLDWRDRGDNASSNELIRVGEDFVKNNQGMLSLSLTDLPAGTYQFTTYHAESGGFDQSAPIKVFVNGVQVTTSHSFGDASQVLNVGDLNSVNVDATAASFMVVSDGINPINIDFDGSANADTETPLNGFLVQHADLKDGLLAKVDHVNGNPGTPIEQRFLISTDLQEDSLSFTDRTHQYNEIPDYLLGAEYIRFANDDRAAREVRNTVWATSEGEAFLFLDDRYGIPQWVLDGGWIDTGDLIGIDEGGDGDIENHFYVYRKVLTGEGPIGLVLHENFQNGGNNYGFAYIIPEPGSFLSLLAMGGLLASRRKK